MKILLTQRQEHRINEITKRLLAGKISQAEFSLAIEKQIEALPAGKLKASMMLSMEGRLDPDDEPRVLEKVKGLVLSKADLDLDDLSQKLCLLCGFIDTLKKNEGGRPRDAVWDGVMLDLAEAFEEATGKRARVTNNEHRAAAGERYSGHFVRLATIVEQGMAAASFNLKPRPNSALGPALIRLLNDRKPQGRSKTR
jgi:hypothetical protein